MPETVPLAATKSAPCNTSEEPGNLCFGCGSQNPQGLHLQFVVRNSDPNAISAAATIQLGVAFEGPPGCVHGGIIATLLDEAMSKLNRPLEVIAMTRHMEVDYLRPVPLGVELTIVGHHVRREGRKLFHTAQILGPDGKVLATSRGVFVVIYPGLITGKH